MKQQVAIYLRLSQEDMDKRTSQIKMKQQHFCAEAFDYPTVELGPNAA